MPDEHFLSNETIVPYFVSRGIVTGNHLLSARELAGGVSSLVWVIHVDDTPRFIVKQALERLRVAQTWNAPRRRLLLEAQALDIAARIVPENVPSVVDVDPELYTITIAHAPFGSKSWKEDLLSGIARVEIATRLGIILAKLHRGSQHELIEGDEQVFEDFRATPFYRVPAERNPIVSAQINLTLQRMLNVKQCLVHGDFSPKNILVAREPWVVDFEAVHRGDPTFDLAYLVHHLALKSVYRPESAVDYRRCAKGFLYSYRQHGVINPFFDFPYLASQIGCLLLARVDGISPVDYLTVQDQQALRYAATQILLSPPNDVDRLWGYLVGRYST